MGALQWGKVVHGHQQWRFVSCMWLHTGLVHLVVNMISLVFIGIRLQQQFGFLCARIIYLLSGFGGILSSLFIWDNISVGASSALFGLLGAMLSELLTNWSIYSNKGAALFTFVIVIGFNLAVGLLSHVENFVHIGGFHTGFFLGFILPSTSPVRMSREPSSVSRIPCLIEAQGLSVCILCRCPHPLDHWIYCGTDTV